MLPPYHAPRLDDYLAGLLADGLITVADGWWQLPS
jgi:hypothetical protein